MFKLLKIVNGRMNVPETEKVRVFITFDVYAGNVYYVSGTKLSATSISGARKFIPIENAIYDTENELRYLYGFYATEEMVFETDLVNWSPGDDYEYEYDENGDPIEPEQMAVECGDILDACSQNTSNDCLHRKTGTMAKVLDMSDFETRGKIVVALKW